MQIILCTYCLEEGGWKHSHGWTETGEVGWGKKGWCWGGAGWRREAGVGAVGLGCFSIEVRGQRW